MMTWARTPEDTERRSLEGDSFIREALDRGKILSERHGSAQGRVPVPPQQGGYQNCGHSGNIRQPQGLAAPGHGKPCPYKKLLVFMGTWYESLNSQKSQSEPKN
jgi:hypothetical protein